MRNIFKTQQPGLVSAACASHVGKKRKNNEDNFYFCGASLSCDNLGTGRTLSLEAGRKQREGGFFAVFDGMGGGDYGEVASYTAAKEAEAFFGASERVDPHDVSLSLNEYCQNANGKVFGAGQELGAGSMGSTLVGLYFLDGRAWVCNLGDSRCYLLRGGRLTQISADHTDERDMKENNVTGRKPYLTQYLGIDPEAFRIEPYISSFSLWEGDVLLLCSDGLTDMVPAEAIGRLLGQDPEAAVESLVAAALDGGGRDNITVMVCRC